MALDERDFFNNRNETRTDKLTCPRCKRTNDYQMRWVVRTKKDRIPPGADERDRALFGKLRDYMIRMDDSVTCKTCGKKFDIPSQHSMVFLQPGVGETQGTLRISYNPHILYLRKLSLVQVRKDLPPYLLLVPVYTTLRTRAPGNVPPTVPQSLNTQSSTRRMSAGRQSVWPRRTR